MGLRRKARADGQYQALQTELARLRNQVTSSGSANDELIGLLRAHVVEVRTLRARIVELEAAAAMAPTAEVIAAMDERLVAIDQRMTSVSKELAHQLDELSGDIEAGSHRNALANGVADELRTTQARLAAEQARYEISFREDLAYLSDQLRDVHRR